MTRPAMITCILLDVAAIAFLAAGLALPYWIIIASPNLPGAIAAYYGVYWSCVYISGTNFCLSGESSSDYTSAMLTTAKALTTATPIVTTLAVIIGIVYLCSLTNRSCGRTSWLITTTIILHVIAIITASAGLGIIYGYYMHSTVGSYASMAYVGYIYITGLILLVLGFLLSLVEACLGKCGKDDDDHKRHREMRQNVVTPRYLYPTSDPYYGSNYDEASYYGGSPVPTYDYDYQ